MGFIKNRGGGGGEGQNRSDLSVRNSETWAPLRSVFRHTSLVRDSWYDRKNIFGAVYLAIKTS